MNMRRLFLIAIVLLLVGGLGNFVWNSVQTRSQLALVAGRDPAAQGDGVQRLMGRGVLFDALQGGAPPDTRLNGIAALSRRADGGKDPAAFREMLQMLKDPDTESAEKKTHPVRDAAKDAVAKVGIQYPDILLDAAKDPDKNIQDQSRAALKAIGVPMEKQMAARLSDPKLRAPFGDILAGIGPETIPLIAPYLQPPLLKADSKPDDLAKAKIELIETLGKFKTAEAAAPLLAYQSDPDPNVRRSVITSLANIGDPSGAPVLIKALTDRATDASARAAAAGALGAIATPDANAAMETALGDYDLAVADAAAAGLKRAGDKAQAAIAHALQSPDASVRARAAVATGGMRGVSLATQALRDPSPLVRSNAADALGDILFRAETVRGDLTRLANATGNPADAQKALDALGKHGAMAELTRPDAPAPARAAAIAALNAQTEKAKDDKARKKITDAIAKIQTPAAPDGTGPLADLTPATLSPLVAALGDKDGTVAQGAGRALGRLGGAAVGPLVSLLSGGDDTVAYYASNALNTIGRPAVDALLPVAQTGKPGARWAAITLGEIGDTRALPSLQALSASPDRDTAGAASAALARMRPG